jgi:hypothetical protein
MSVLIVDEGTTFNSTNALLGQETAEDDHPTKEWLKRSWHCLHHRGMGVSPVVKGPTISPSMKKEK